MLYLELVAKAAWVWWLVLRPEGLRRLEQAAAQIEPEDPPGLVAAVRSAWAIVFYPQVNAGHRIAAQEAVDALRGPGDRRALFRALAALARITSVSSDLDTCARAAAEMQDIFDPAWPEPARWAMLRARMLVPFYRGRPQELLSDAHEALAIARRSGDDSLMHASLMYLEQAAQALGHWDEAVERGQELMTLRAGKPSWGHASEVSNLALALTRVGRLTEARALAHQAMANHAAAGTSWRLLEVVALLAAARGLLRAAALVCGRSQAATAIHAEGVREPDEARAFDEALATLRAALESELLDGLLARGAAMTDEAALAEMGLVLPGEMRVPPGFTIKWRQTRVIGTRVLIAGHGPRQADGSFAGKPGKVGAELTLAEGYQSALDTALAILGDLRRELGGLDRVANWVRVFGMVNSSTGFKAQPRRSLMVLLT